MRKQIEKRLKYVQKSIYIFDQPDALIDIINQLLDHIDAHNPDDLKSIREWALDLGMDSETLRYRIKKYFPHLMKRKIGQVVALFPFEIEQIKTWESKQGKKVNYL